MLDFAYTAMDALRGILIVGLVEDDHTKSGRRWRRASEHLRRGLAPELQEWLAEREA